MKHHRRQFAAISVASLSHTVKGGLRTRRVDSDYQRGHPQPPYSRGLVGGADYCVWSPNLACWPASRGFPPCCIDGKCGPRLACSSVRPLTIAASGVSETANVTCPDEVPDCENSNVESYCVGDPDTTCYLEGWPGCCSAGRCPLQQPPCDVETGTVSTESSSKGSYCALPPDYDCFSGGLPACCQLGENRVRWFVTSRRILAMALILFCVVPNRTTSLRCYQADDHFPCHNIDNFDRSGDVSADDHRPYHSRDDDSPKRGS